MTTNKADDYWRAVEQYQRAVNRWLVTSSAMLADMLALPRKPGVLSLDEHLRAMNSEQYMTNEALERAYTLHQDSQRYYALFAEFNAQLAPLPAAPPPGVTRARMRAVLNGESVTVPPADWAALQRMIVGGGQQP